MQRYVCASKHFLQYMISIKHEICSSRIEWFSILQIKEMHNLRPPKIPLRHTKDVSDVWHVYPKAVSMRNQYVPSFVYKILRALQQNLIKWKYLVMTILCRWYFTQFLSLLRIFIVISLACMWRCTTRQTRNWLDKRLKVLTCGLLRLQNAYVLWKIFAQ